MLTLAILGVGGCHRESDCLRQATQAQAVLDRMDDRSVVDLRKGAAALLSAENTCRASGGTVEVKQLERARARLTRYAAKLGPDPAQ